MRFDETTMSDPEVVADYDFASNSLVSELIAQAETENDFGYDKKLQRLVDTIRQADERVVTLREEYDDIASRFNKLIERKLAFLHHIDSQKLQKGPLFQMAVE